MSVQSADVLTTHPEHFRDFIVASKQFVATPLTLGGTKVWPGLEVPDIVIYPLAMLVASGLILALMSVTAMVMTWIERKVAGHIQSRLGPMRVGPHGVIQPMADGLKLFFKEDLIPEHSNRFLFSAAPALVFLGAMTPFVSIPFAYNWIIADMDTGVFYVLAFAALEVIGVIMAGWAASSKWSLYGGMRLAAQMISYEIPMGLSVLTVVMLTGSLSLNRMAESQSTLPFVFQSPFALIAFIIFYIASLASTKRAPFDLPEAESELVSGFHTEYSGMRFAYFFLAEYASMGLVSGIAAVVFLGGYNFPFNANNNALLGFGQMSAKVGALLFFMVWLRWTLPRVRVDQVMYMCLKVLLPLAMFCVIGAAVEVVTGASIICWIVVAALTAAFFVVARLAPPKDASRALNSL